MCSIIAWLKKKKVYSNAFLGFIYTTCIAKYDQFKFEIRSLIIFRPSKVIEACVAKRSQSKSYQGVSGNTEVPLNLENKVNQRFIVIVTNLKVKVRLIFIHECILIT